MRRGELKRKTPLRSRRSAEEEPEERNPFKPTFPEPKGKPKRRRVDQAAIARGELPKWMIPPPIRAAVVERDRGLCQSCLAKGTRRQGTELHHIMFRSAGGKHVVENLVLLCVECHHGPEGPHQTKAGRRRLVTWACEKYGLDVMTWALIAGGKAPAIYTTQEETEHG